MQPQDPFCGEIVCNIRVYLSFALVFVEVFNFGSEVRFTVYVLKRF